MRRAWWNQDRRTHSPGDGGALIVAAPLIPDSPTGQPDPATTGSPPSPPTPAPPSPADPAPDPKPDPAPDPEPDPKPEDAATAEAEAARALVPEAADGYKINLAPEVAKYTGDASDPAMKALREHAAAEKWPQGKFDDTMNLIKVFAEKGVLQEMFDPAAETLKLGDQAVPRRQEVETFFSSLKERGEISPEEYAEAMSLAPTAAGVTLIEKIRKMMGPAGALPKTPSAEGGVETTAMDAARAQRQDPRYDRDPAFKRAADQAWIKAFEESRPK